MTNDTNARIAEAKAAPFVLEKVNEKDLISTLEEIFSESLFGAGEKIIELYMPESWEDGYLVQTENAGVYRLYLIKRGGKTKEALDFRIVGSYLEAHGAKFVINPEKGEVALGPTLWIITDHKVFLKGFTEIPTVP